jgi:tRNA threonylcarbamoyladenosine biosynthesis protein TsaE
MQHQLEHFFHSSSLALTRRLGERLGRVLVAGDVIALLGDLGAGKTSFVQGLARGLGVPRERRIGSPSFTLVNEHAGRVSLYHVDLYRIEDESELDEIGLAEYLAGAGVAVVEWFDRFPAYVPAERLEVRLTITGARSRDVQALAYGSRAAERLRRWVEEASAA